MMHAGGRAAVVAVAICSWIAISNHCAFAAVATKTSAQNECPFHSKPAKQKEQPSHVQCCKILRAVAPMPIFIVVRARSSLLVRKRRWHPCFWTPDRPARTHLLN